MGWTVVQRNYHEIEAESMRRWVVCRDGELRGICECWEQGAAEKIAAVLNKEEVADG